MGARLYAVRKLHRCGNSQQVTIPADICKVMGFELHDRVYVYIVGGVVCLKKMDEGGFATGVVAIAPPRGADVEAG
jgi:bifunctional DNA-binding transcriptional regulator/antitoxin component of YhaV-PrlF toxin-antitoxin module